MSDKPVCHLVWHQYLRAADDVEDYFEVARPGDKCVDGSDPFPVYAAPPSTSISAQIEAIRLWSEQKYGEAFSVSACHDLLSEISTVKKDNAARLDLLNALVEPMEGIVHFQDALDFRNDNLSKALRQWIEAGEIALQKLKASQPT